MNVSFKDFQPINTWKPALDGLKWSNGEPEHLIDMTTGRRYWNESKGCVGFKCFLLTFRYTYCSFNCICGKYRL